MVPYHKSLMYAKTRLLADASLVHGREFHARWAGDWVFVHSGKQIGIVPNEAKKAIVPHIFSTATNKSPSTFGLCDMNVNVEQVSMKTNEGIKQFMEVYI
jgi:hypothetical protein